MPKPQQILRPRPIAYASHRGYNHHDDGFGTWVRLVLLRGNCISSSSMFPKCFNQLQEPEQMGVDIEVNMTEQWESRGVQRIG